jgi:hypothetical protein
MSKWSKRSRVYSVRGRGNLLYRNMSYERDAKTQQRLGSKTFYDSKRRCEREDSRSDGGI